MHIWIKEIKKKRFKQTNALEIKILCVGILAERDGGEPAGPCGGMARGHPTGCWQHMKALSSTLNGEVGGKPDSGTQSKVLRAWPGSGDVHSHDTPVTVSSQATTSS
jgi:hypothetical protein